MLNKLCVKINDLTDGCFTGIRGAVKYDRDSGEMEIVGGNEEGEYCSINIKGNSDGDYSMTLTDEDGTATVVANERESVITFPDGSFIKTDMNSEAAEMYIPADGIHIKLNEEGEVEIFEIRGDDGASLSFEDGKFITRDENGNVVSVVEKKAETGDTTVTNAAGETYTITKDGKVLKNGMEIKPESDNKVNKNEEQEDTPSENEAVETGKAADTS